MLEKIIEWDKKLFLALNSLHHPSLDPAMVFMSEKLVWIPLYFFLLFIILKEFKNDSWAPVLGILITIILSDQINTSILKPLVQRLRPTHDPSLANLVYFVNGYTGGKFGFASSHASNTFGLATFFWMWFRGRQKWMILLFLWAALISYSRIYLGVHFPGDVMAGMIIGTIIAIASCKLCRWLLDYSYKQRSSPLG
jgi:undecaprenyl-diphosphatase